MNEPLIVWGVWERFFDENELIDLYRSREDAEARVRLGGVIGGVDYGDMPRWHVEQHVVRGKCPVCS